MTIDPDSLLGTTLAAITPTNSEALALAEERQNQLTKPPGSLGLLEAIGCQLSAITGEVPPPIPSHPILAVFAGDHGVYDQQITPWPQEVTVQMLINMCYGGASINALAPETGTAIWPVDIGIANTVPDAPGLRRLRVRNGTADFTKQPAMSVAEAQQAIEVGITLANEAIADGADVLLTGEVGLGNTTSAAALIAVLTDTDPELTTGRGSGSDDQMLNRKIDAIRRGITLHQPTAADPLGVLSALGGLELAGMAGFILGGAAHKTPVILDGVLSCASALIAVGLNPDVSGYLIAGHLGDEPGIRVALNRLGLPALCDLELRLGEGSGALIALSIVRAAARVLRDMATFADAGVSGKVDG
ncbi:MAG: nicotinate-nucleotide--dimethylbenzimidazole phosphoribosyltransferase [Propionibacterium sp.]|nr:nicotinate-nucleotide--dimethylbenzimidazole phosphoribosyltransferase [Propionibacterium sp.]